MIEYKIKKDGVEKVINIEPKKITDYTYIIEKQDPMNVPVKIFADEKLIKKMQEDACLKQGVNVACLPGIKKFSFMKFFKANSRPEFKQLIQIEKLT